jgi:hypothetical protein
MALDSGTRLGPYEIWGAAFAPDGRLEVGRASIKNNIILFCGLKRPAR